MRDFLKHRSTYNTNDNKKMSSEEFRNIESKLWNSRNYLIATATYHFKYTQKLSVGISRLQSLTNVLRVCITLFFGQYHVFGRVDKEI